MPIPDRRAWRACLLGLFLSLPLYSQAETLSLGRALDLAERHSPRLQSALAEVERNRSGIRTARTYPNPEIEAMTGGVRGRLPGIPSGRGTSLMIGQPIDLPSHRAPRIRAAEAGFEGSRFAADEARLTLRADVKQAFYTALRRKAEYLLYLDNQRLLEQIRDRIELSVKVGERPKFELVRVDAELSSAINQATSARLRITQALATLRTLIGASLPPEFDVEGELGTQTLTSTYDVLQTQVLERHPALKRARADLARAESRLEAERALKVPRPTLYAGIDRDPEQSRAQFGVSIPLPVWDRRQGPVGEAVAVFQQSGFAQEQTRIELLGELEINYNRLLVARQQIAAYEGGLIRQAENALKVAEAAFKFGERGFIEVLDAQRVLRTIRAEFLNARFEKQSALVELERLIAQDIAGENK